MSDISHELSALRERLARLERGQHRRQRSTKQKGAAEYIGRSREYLRQRYLKGKNPRRNADGSYDYSALDDYLDNPD